MTRRGAVLLAVLVLVGQFAGDGAGATALRQGVEGNTYVSPTFGWSISWDDDWSVDDEGSDDGYDYLTLTDPLSIVFFEAYEGYDGDPDACIEDVSAELEELEGVEDIELGTGGDGEPLTGNDRTGAYAVYTYVLIDEDDVTFDVAQYSDCRTLVADEAVLEITQVTTREAYNDSIPAFQTLLDNLAMPGEDPVDAPSTTERETAGPDDEELTVEQARELVETASEDLTAFWTDVFAEHDLFYVAPFYVVVEDETEIPCAGGTTHPGAGSFYCPLNQTIYFDMSAELSDASGYGRSSVYYTMGHEAAHDIQMQLGVTLAGTMSVEMELEADCMAGSYLATLVERDELSEDEFMTLLELVQSFGDPRGVSASDEGAHGLGSQRVSMVLRGYYNGVDACGTF